MPTTPLERQEESREKVRDRERGAERARGGCDTGKAGGGRRTGVGSDGWRADR